MPSRRSPKIDIGSSTSYFALAKNDEGDESTDISPEVGRVYVTKGRQKGAWYLDDKGVSQPQP